MELWLDSKREDNKLTSQCYLVVIGNGRKKILKEIDWPKIKRILTM